MNKMPGLLDILEAVFDCYDPKGVPTHLFTLWKKDVGDVLRQKGFATDDQIIWERLHEFDKSIQVLKANQNGTETITYWMCQPDQEAFEKDESKGMPFKFRAGVVANQLADLRRKRQLENEQLHFWGLYRWGVVLAVIGSICAIVQTVCALVKACHP